MRRTGASKRSIANALAKPTTTVHAVIERAPGGDPAPADLLAKETATKKKTIERLQAQLAKLEAK